MVVCNHDCEHCKYEDCIEDDISYLEIRSIEEEDRNLGGKRRLTEEEKRRIHNEQSKKWQREHKDKVKETSHTYYMNNKEACKQRTYKWIREHKEQFYENRKKYLKAYYEKNKERLSAQRRERYRRKKLERLAQNGGE